MFNADSAIKEAVRVLIGWYAATHCDSSVTEDDVHVTQFMIDNDSWECWMKINEGKLYMVEHKKEKYHEEYRVVTYYDLDDKPSGSTAMFDGVREQVKDDCDCDRSFWKRVGSVNADGNGEPAGEAKKDDNSGNFCRVTLNMPIDEDDTIFSSKRLEDIFTGLL